MILVSWNSPLTSARSWSLFCVSAMTDLCRLGRRWSCGALTGTAWLVSLPMAGTTKPTVYKWIDRFEEGGLGALDSRRSTGRPPSVSGEVRARRILALTKVPPPAETGLTHWSSYEMSRYLRRSEGISVSHNFVSMLWRECDLQPHRQGTFKVSRDPDFATKVADIVGLYLDPPVGAVVLSFDEKTQVQALERTQPLLPISFGKTEKRTHDYVRHGTTNLFAALDVLTGNVIGRCFDWRRTTEFITFMSQVLQQYPQDKEIHVVLDNLSTHNNEDVDAWLAKHSERHFPLHANRCILDQSDRDMVRHHHPASDPSQLFHLPCLADQEDQPLHHEGY